MLSDKGIDVLTISRKLRARQTSQSRCGDFEIVTPRARHQVRGYESLDVVGIG
jgi:hypothetical protein